MSKNLNYFKTVSAFETEQSNLNSNSISFIEETKQIYTHDNYFGGTNLLWRETTSDSEGMITIDEIEGYRFLEAVSFNNGQPLNIIRFGDNLYIGYYGGASLPSSSSPVDLLFTSVPNNPVYICYVSI